MSVRKARSLADLPTFLVGPDNVESPDNPNPLPAVMLPAPRQRPRGPVMEFRGLERERVVFYQTAILRFLSLAPQPPTANMLREGALHSRVDVDMARRLIQSLVDEGRVRFGLDRTPGREPATVYFLADRGPAGGGA